MRSGGGITRRMFILQHESLAGILISSPAENFWRGKFTAANPAIISADAANDALASAPNFCGFAGLLEFLCGLRLQFSGLPEVT
jgi:hypothetical protein